MVDKQKQKPLPIMEEYRPPHPLVDDIFGTPFDKLRENEGRVKEIEDEKDVRLESSFGRSSENSTAGR